MPNLKKMYLVRNCMFLSYALHIPVINFSCSAECCQKMKFSLQWNCNSISAYHGTASIKHNKIYLPPVRLRAPLPAFGGVATAATSAATSATGARWRGGRSYGSSRRRGLLRGSSKCQGSRCLHSACSRDAQQLFVIRRQQGLQLCTIIRMSSDVISGTMCFELFFGCLFGLLDTLSLARAVVFKAPFAFGSILKANPAV